MSLPGNVRSCLHLAVSFNSRIIKKKIEPGLGCII